jgi:RNA polymerase sigma factor (TIGR02999 family)
LLAAARGEPGATEQLLPLLYEHLRAMARAKLSHESAGQTLQPTALVHEAYLKLVRSEKPWADRKHFFAAAALAMRRILVDRARAKKGAKRDAGGAKLSLEAWQAAEPGTRSDTEADADDWLSLEGAMQALQEHDAELSQIVHLRYFAGLTVDETAMAMGKSARTINRDWLVARAWLLRRIETHPAQR